MTGDAVVCKRENSGNRTPSIAVVLSTYNGCEHIREQLDSVLAQNVPNLEIYVRDDGSTDSTCEILEEYESRGQLVLSRGSNIGVVRSFLEAISLVPSGTDYIALCDQDDVWHEDKLRRAIDVLEAHDSSIPLYYCAEYMFCDADMHPVARSELVKSSIDFARMLYENATSGNTCVMNRALLDKLLAAGADGVYCHDWWFALVAATLGEVVHDNYCCLEYRRTGSNASPTGSSGLALLHYRVKTFFDKGELSKVVTQLQRLEDVFGREMLPERKSLLQRFLTGGRMSKALSPVRLRQKISDEIALRFFFLLGLL